LGSWVDFLVMPSNSPHIFQREVEQAAGRRLLSIIDVTLAEVQRRHLQTVGVLGFGEPTVYLNVLKSLNIACETISPDLARRLTQQIIALMEGRAGAEGHSVAKEAVDNLRAGEAQGIILGCTEIPLLLGEEHSAPDLLNPAQLLAEAAIREAL
jgi:aspartate racemase